jgi:hypothetical protein
MDTISRRCIHPHRQGSVNRYRHTSWLVNQLLKSILGILFRQGSQALRLVQKIFSCIIHNSNTHISIAINSHLYHHHHLEQIHNIPTKEKVKVISQKTKKRMKM